MTMRPLSFNERRLIELTFRQRQITRGELSRTTDMTAASITRLVNELIEFGIFKQSVQKDGARGQPKKILTLQGEKFCAVGVYLHIDRIQAVLIDFAGNVLATYCHELKQIKAAILPDILMSITDDLLRKGRGRKQGFIGIGLALPGNFGSSGKRLWAHEAFAGLDGAEILEQLSNRSQSPVYLENDGTAVALGEYLFGGHVATDPLFLIHIGHGLGGGAVLDGRPYRGLNGNACLPGALFPYGEARPTLQDLEAFLNDNTLDKSQVLTASSKASRLSLESWMCRTSKQLASAARIVAGMFDPAIIVLGGALPAWITTDLACKIEKMNLEGPSRGLILPPIMASRLGDLNGPIGAASIPFFHCFFPGSVLPYEN